MMEGFIPLAIILGYFIVGSVVSGLYIRRWGSDGDGFEVLVAIMWPVIGFVALCVRIYEAVSGRRIK